MNHALGRALQNGLNLLHLPYVNWEMREFFRWACVSSLAYFGGVLYAALAGGATWLVSPRYARRVVGDAGATLADFALAAGSEGMRWGILLAPVFGFLILRDVHESVRVPEDVRHWWRRAHREGVRRFGRIGLAGLGLGALWAAAALGTGAAAARDAFADGFLWGNLVAVALMAYGAGLVLRGSDQPT